MVTLIRVGNSEGERRCDERCYGAATPDCDCVCGGMNHGKGRAQAEKNTAEVGEKLIEQWLEKNPDYRDGVAESRRQLGLFRQIGFDDSGNPTP